MLWFLLSYVDFPLLLLLGIGFLSVFYYPKENNKKQFRKILEFLQKCILRQTYYPESRSFQPDVDSITELFGLEVPEPFKLLEIESSKRKEWLEKQEICYVANMEHLKFTR